MFFPRIIFRNGSKLSHNISRTYRAALLHDYKTEIKVQEIKDKTPGDHEVLIKNETAGLNHADWMIRKGEYHLKPVLPTTLGGEWFVINLLFFLH